MSAASPYRASLVRFNRTATKTRRGNYPAQVTVSTGAVLCVAKLPTQVTRVPQEQGTGWVQEAVATYLFPGTGTFTPTIGCEFTLTTSDDSTDEEGTTWRCRELKRSGAGHEHRAVCFRLD